MVAAFLRCKKSKLYNPFFYKLFKRLLDCPRDWVDPGTQISIGLPRRGQLGGLLKGLGRARNPDIHKLATQGAARGTAQETGSTPEPRYP